MLLVRSCSIMCLLLLFVVGTLVGDDAKTAQKVDEKQPTKESPQPYTSKEGKYKIVFPATIKVEEKTMDIPIGEQKVKLYLTGRDDDKLAFLASYVDYPKELFENVDLDSMLDGVVKGIVKGMKGKEKSIEKIKVEGLNAREVSFEVPEHKAHGKARVFLLNNRLYQIVGFEDTEKPVHVDAFLKSFEFIKEKKIDEKPKN